MSGTSINLTLFFFVWCMIICSFVVCSAEYASSDSRSILRRFYRSDTKAEHKADHPSNVPIKLSPGDKQKDTNVPSKLSPGDKQKDDQPNPASNISMAEKSVDSKSDSHLNQPVGGMQHDNAPVDGIQHDNLPVGGHNLNQGALLRGFYVFVGLSAIVVIYIVVKTISVRRKKSTVRKYGILTNREDVEMTPLGAEDEEEDTTLFDVSNQTRP